MENVTESEVVLLVLGFLKEKKDLFPETLQSFLKEAAEIGTSARFPPSRHSLNTCFVRRQKDLKLMITAQADP